MLEQQLTSRAPGAQGTQVRSPRFNGSVAQWYGHRLQTWRWWVRVPHHAFWERDGRAAVTLDEHSGGAALRVPLKCQSSTTAQSPLQYNGRARSAGKRPEHHSSMTAGPAANRSTRQSDRDSTNAALISLVSGWG